MAAVVVRDQQGRVVEERALVKVGAFAACGAFEPVANELAAFDQGGDLRELAVGHIPQPVDRLTVIGRRGQQQLDLVERRAWRAGRCRLPPGCARCGGGSGVARPRGPVGAAARSARSSGSRTGACPQGRPARRWPAARHRQARDRGFDIKSTLTPTMVRSPRSGRTTADRGATGNRHE